MAKKKAKTSKKISSKPSLREKPKVVSVVACDSIVQQQAPSGKTMLVGVFDRINVTNPKRPFRPFSVMTKLFGGSGKFRVGIQIQTPSRAKKQHTEDDVEINCSPEEMIQGIMTVASLDVSEDGFVNFFVTLDGKRAGIPCPVKIVHIETEEPTDSD